MDKIWAEKYRPQTIEGCILPKKLKKTFQKMVEENKLMNMVLSGSPGTGKTTVARALCNELGASSLFINASDENGIDTIRVKIRDFASTVSLDDSPKVVILDEADYLNPNSAQPALRAFIEEFSGNARFILTCNYKNRLIPALRDSRMPPIDFVVPQDEVNKLQAQVFKMLIGILEAEGVEYCQNTLAKFVKRYYPDTRAMIMRLQNYAIADQKIDEGILAQANEMNLKGLFKAMQKKSLGDVRKWVVDNGSNDVSLLFTTLYDGLYNELTADSIASAVVIVADYQYKSAFVADQEINTLACLVEIMMECEFK